MSKQSNIKTFDDVPQLISSRGGMWTTQFDWKSIGEWIGRTETKVELNPDFQRGHVWNVKQQSAYVEFCLRGGRSGQDVYFNQKGGSLHNLKHPYVCVDGLQRLTAITAFMDNKLTVYDGLTCADMIAASKNKRFPIQTLCIRICVNNLQTDADVMRWYLEMNAGGTPHAPEEIKRVRALLSKTEKAKK